MNTIALLFCLSCSVHSKAQQNLVPNGDFEEYYEIPDGFLRNAVKFETFVKNWLSPTNGTPDYFHTLATNRENSIPNQEIKIRRTDQICVNYLDSHSGEAYAGLLFIYFGRLINEYLQVQLTNQLKSNHKYYISWIHAKNRCSHIDLSTFGVLIGKDSIRQFYPNSYQHPNWTNFEIRYKPQYYMPIEKYASTTWVENEFILKAKGGERWLTIGNFWQDGQYDSLFSPLLDTTIEAYYFIDNVSLVEIPCLVGQDTACVGEEVTFYSTFAGPFEWWHQDELVSTDSIYTFIAEEGWYYLKTPFGEDSIYLYVVQDLPLFEDIQKQICEGENAEIQLPSQFIYQWQDGNSSGSRNFTEPANQWVEVSTNYCKDTFNVTVEVQPLPAIDIQRYYEFCKDSLMGIEVFLPDIYEYLWTDGHQGAYKLLSAEGLYPFIIQDPFECKSSDSIVVKEDCPVRVWMPNAFAPEGENRIFRPIMRGVEKATLVIYNRWGEKIYEETASHPSWNGIYQGEGCMQGVYHYQLIVYKNNEKEQFSGVVHLVR